MSVHCIGEIKHYTIRMRQTVKLDYYPNISFRPLENSNCEKSKVSDKSYF